MRGAEVLLEAPAQSVLNFMRDNPGMTDNEIIGGLTDLGSWGRHDG